MSNNRNFSDEELTAFLDGEFEYTRVEEIRRALKNNADIQARVEALALDRSKINTALDLLLDGAPTMPELPETEADKSSLSMAKHMGLIAAFSIVFLVGGLYAGYIAGQNKDENWREFVATYQMLYINATLSGIDQNPEDASAELDLISQTFGKNVDLSALVQQSQLDYKRAQILGFEGKPLMQLTFLSKIGAPIALCIFPSKDRKNRDIVVDEMRGMFAAYWSRDGFEYLLIGGRDAALIKNAATEFAGSL